MDSLGIQEQVKSFSSKILLLQEVDTVRGLGFANILTASETDIILETEEIDIHN